MSQQPSSISKRFTVDEANAMLPLVKAITSDISKTAQDYIERRQRFTALTDGRNLDTKNPYDEELADVQRELEEQGQRLQEYVEELQALDVELKSMTDGLIDFPARMRGRDVYLCWQLGEEEVMYWHECDAGFSGRQPLYAEAAAGNDMGEDDSLML